MSRRNSRMLRTVLAYGLSAAGLFAGAGHVQAYNGFLTDWTTLYPNSTSGQAGCQTCHGSNSSTLNAYGKDLCVALGGIVPKDVKPYLQSIETLDSDADSTGSSNKAEIDANAQPGWKALANQLYTTLCAPTGATVAPPSGVPLPYDPVPAGMPVAVPGGPYSALVGIPIVFDGTGSFDSDGTIASYEWDFGDGSAPDTHAVSEHAYAAEGTYTVTLTVTDNVGNTSTNATTATVSPGTALDLDIAGLSIGKLARVGKPISIKLSVENKGSVLGQALATIVGRVNGVVVYSWRQNVFDDLSRGSTSFTFPAHTPTAKGTIDWTAEIDDGDLDADLASATTVVK